MCKQKVKLSDDIKAGCILVGTYRPNQLKEWGGYYNYPITHEEADSVLPFANELWLYNGVKKRVKLKAEFVDYLTRDELIKKYKYPNGTEKAHSDLYALYKTEPIYDEVGDASKKMLVRIRDFSKNTPELAEKLKVYIESDGQDANKLSKILPPDVLIYPKENLCVSEFLIQYQLFSDAEINSDIPFPAPDKPRFTFIDLFAGIGGIRLAYQAVGGKCVFSSEWDVNAAKTYAANFGETPFGDIQKISPDDIPDFDVLLAGFPCQPFSIIGAKQGFQHETQGTLFFNIEKILLAKKPKAFMLENVRNLTAHDKGRTFKIILEHLEKAGYKVYYKVLNALDYGVPQKRERIIICGFLDDVDFEFPLPLPKESRKKIADIIDEDASNDRSLFVKPNIRASRLERIKDKNFPKPYMSHENVGGSITPHDFSCALRAGASANYILINDERRPSAREMLRIQGFPDNYKIVVNYGHIKHQTGNSVAVPVITAVAEKLVSSLGLPKGGKDE